MGVVLYVLITRVIPFEPTLNEEVERLFEGNPELDPPEEENEDDPLNNFRSISEECKDLISLMLRANPEERISIKEALKHPWFNLYNDEDDENEKGYKETAEIFDAIDAADSKHIDDV